MGRGDQRTRQGKIRRGTYGNTRPKGHKRNKAYKAAQPAASRPGAARPAGGASGARP
jgi:ribosomal small subunit protein bTHX